jgi:hypothetical protein
MGGDYQRKKGRVNGATARCGSGGLICLAVPRRFVVSEKVLEVNEEFVGRQSLCLALAHETPATFQAVLETRRRQLLRQETGLRSRYNRFVL